MIALSAVVNAVFLSPLLLVLFIAAGLALLAARRRKTAAWLLSLTAFLILALSTGVGRDLVLRPLEYRSPPFPTPPPSVDAIVVLGGGVTAGTPDEGAASLSPSALKRVVHGVALYRRLSVPVIVAGGTTWRERDARPEAEVGAEALAGFGVPEDRIIREGTSRTTWENAREVAALLRGGGSAAATGSRGVALVTSAWHMPRALMAFTRAGIPCVPAPVDYISGSRRWTASDFVPSFGALEGSFRGLQEYVGIVFYALRRPPAVS
jgi:uncharacterized SAM-binding protein YcdF (DUF218 family)